MIQWFAVLINWIPLFVDISVRINNPVGYNGCPQPSIFVKRNTSSNAQSCHHSQPEQVSDGEAETHGYFFMPGVLVGALPGVSW